MDRKTNQKHAGVIFAVTVQGAEGLVVSRDLHASTGRYKAFYKAFTAASYLAACSAAPARCSPQSAMLARCCHSHMGEPVLMHGE